MAARPQSFTFYDAKQQTARLSIYVSDAGTIAQQEGDAQQIGTDLAAMSNSSTAAGGILRGKGPYSSVPVPVAPGAQATYLDASDKAVFVFQDAQGGLHKYQVACPLAAVFQADQETVDFTQAAVKQFVADMTFTTFAGTDPITTHPILTRNGIALTASVGGYRRRAKAPRKFNIYTRNAALSGQGGAP